MPNGAVHWCITINNYDESTLPGMFEHSAVAYSIRGFEVGESGTPHIQGYVAFRNRRRLNQVTAIFVGCHAEKKRGTVRQAIDYCKKDGKFIEYGEAPAEQTSAANEVTRQRYARAIELAKEDRLHEFEQEDPELYTRFYATYKRIAYDNRIKPADLPDVCGMWYYGVSGAGKTTQARTSYPTAYIKDRTKWWDGYTGQECVIMDDVSKYHVALGDMLKDWGDKYSFKAEYKGGYFWIRPLVFIVTSQYSIDSIWEDCETRDALHRRFKSTHFLNKYLQ